MNARPPRASYPVEPQWCADCDAAGDRQHDPRFTPELGEAVARVLVEHGFPEFRQLDHDRMARLLFRFVFVGGVQR